MAIVFLVLKIIYCDCLVWTTHLWYWSSLELPCNQLLFQLHCFQRMIEVLQSQKSCWIPFLALLYRGPLLAQHILTGHWNKSLLQLRIPLKCTRYLKRKSLSPPEVVQAKTCNLHILISVNLYFRSTTVLSGRHFLEWSWRTVLWLIFPAGTAALHPHSSTLCSL